MLCFPTTSTGADAPNLILANGRKGGNLWTHSNSHFVQSKKGTEMR